MIAKQLISEIIQPLKTSNTGTEALNWMNIFKVRHLPIVNNLNFLGLISEDDIFDLNITDQAIGNHKLSLNKAYVFNYEHIYVALKTIAENNLTLLPVLDNDKNYQGVISSFDIIKYFSDLSNVSREGGIIVLEINQHDYSLVEISNIIESNNAKILSLYVNSIPESTLLNITIKVNVTDISAITQTFNRYNYLIKFTFLEEDLTQELYQERYEEFIKYLNI